jgi:hypothetical protein
MPYSVVTSAEFDEDFLRVPPAIQLAALDCIDALADDPISLAVKSGIPYLRQGMMYQFELREDSGMIHYVTVRFVYSDVRSENQLQLIQLHDMTL